MWIYDALNNSPQSSHFTYYKLGAHGLKFKIPSGGLLPWHWSNLSYFPTSYNPAFSLFSSKGTSQMEKIVKSEGYTGCFLFYNPGQLYNSPLCLKSPLSETCGSYALLTIWSIWSDDQCRYTMKVTGNLWRQTGQRQPTSTNCRRAGLMKLMLFI